MIGNYANLFQLFQNISEQMPALEIFYIFFAMGLVAKTNSSLYYILIQIKKNIVLWVMSLINYVLFH